MQKNHKNIFVVDRSSYSISSREYTDEGFLRAPGRVGRSGIQQYLASELDEPGNRAINVYRPPEEVFSTDSLNTYNVVDITLNHPESLIDSSSYKQKTVGVVVGPAVRDGDYVLCDLIIKDAEAIKAIESGKVELSAGYIANYEKKEGVTEDGEPYEFIQRDIKINHVALVDRARAGRSARIFDENKGKKMSKIVLDSGRSIEIDNEEKAAMVQDSIDNLKKKAEEAAANLSKSQAVADAAKEELTELKAKFSDENIKLMIQDAAKVSAVAAKLGGEKYACDSMVVSDMQKAALKLVRPSVKWDEKNTDYVQAAFDAAIEKMEEDEEEEEMKKKESKDHLDKFKTVGDKEITTIDSHRAERKASLSSSWKTGGNK